MILLIFITASFLLFLYCTLIFVYRFWFVRLKPFGFDFSRTAKTKFSIIIPARNEEENIEACLNSVYQNNYPKDLFEIIVINDLSTDKTVELIQKIQAQHSNLKLLHTGELFKGRQLNSYKKKAIQEAVNQSGFEWIVTTDADCTVPKNWLSNFDNYIQQTDKKFIAAPVKFINDHTFLSRFQCLDFLSLQGITAASVSAGFHAMCNGANLCYEKEIFRQVNGFDGIDHLASGDDMLLMHKIQAKYSHATGYLYSQESIVATQTMKTLHTFIHQRIRWASKAGNYSDPRITSVLWLVYLTNLFLCIGFAAAFFEIHFLLYWLVLLVLKTIAEFFFMQKTAAFYREEKLLKWFPAMQPFHIAYTVVAGFWGRFGKYNWKGRSVQ